MQEGSLNGIAFGADVLCQNLKHKTSTFYFAKCNAKCQSNCVFNCVEKECMEGYFQQTHTLTPTAPYGVRAVLDAKETFESKR